MPDDRAAAASTRRMLVLIVSILALMAGGLGLKAWEERQSAEIAHLGLIQSEARAIAARISARAELASAMIGVVDVAGISRSEAAGTTRAIDAIVSLRDAAQSAPGTRLGDAAAAIAGTEGETSRIGLSPQGDLVVGMASDDGSFTIALAPVDEIIGIAREDARITLRTDTVGFGLGNPAFADAADAIPVSGSHISGGPGGRAASACAPVARSDMAACVTVPAPLLTLNDLVRFLIFSLLLAAPALAIFGLGSRLSKHQTQVIVQETRNEESDRILSLVMRGARAGYWECPVDASSLYLSEGAAELLGMQRAGIISLEDLLEYVAPDNHGRVREGFTKARSIGWIHLTFATSMAPLRWLEMRGSASEDPGGGGSVFGGILLDITERKQSEDRVKAAERRLRAAIEGFNGPFALWDQRQRLLYWNRAFALDFGLQDTLRPGMGRETVLIARAGAVLLERQSAEDARTMLIALRNGRWLKTVERSTPDGGLITVGVDVTENVRNEEELKKQKERMKRAVLDLERSEGRASELSRKYSEEKAKAEHAAHTKSAFLANMSHELRTPLNAIIGFSDIMVTELRGPLGDPIYKDYARDILTSGQHLLDMINDILDMAKIEAGKMTISTQPIDPVDPVDAAMRMIRRKAEEKNIELNLEAHPRLPDIDADHRAIRQMVLNLVSNALKFTDPGGKITVTVEQRGPEIYFAVTDTGIGIPAEDLPRLAQPFEQVSSSRDRNTDGTGLGLALTKSFAEMHGGRMSLSSVYGEGTTVAFILPIGGPESVGLGTRDVA